MIALACGVYAVTRLPPPKKNACSSPLARPVARDSVARATTMADQPFNSIAGLTDDIVTILLIMVVACHKSAFYMTLIGRCYKPIIRVNRGFVV